MKAEDLRVGNLIEFEDGTIVRCTGIHPSGNYFHNGKQWIEVFRYEPIPITKEWLVKFGFFDWEDGSFDYEDDFEFSINLEDQHITWLNQVYRSSYCHHLLPKYVHQLQNLYFTLTGEELTIKESENEKENN